MNKLFFIPKKGEKDAVLSDNIDIMIALLPLIAWGVYSYGAVVLSTLLLSVLVAVLCEFLICLSLKKQSLVLSGRSVLEGALVTLILPPTAGVLLVVLATLVSCLVAYILNEYSPVRLPSAVCGAGVLYIFAHETVSKLLPFGKRVGFFGSADGLAVGMTEEAYAFYELSLPSKSLWAELFGIRGGLIGECSVALIIICAIWLAVRKKRYFSVTAAACVSVIIYSYLYPSVAIVTDIISIQFALYRIICSPVPLICALYISSPEYCPKTGTGRVIFGVVYGLGVALLSKVVGFTPAALALAVVLPLLTPLLDKFFINRNLFG